MGPERPSPRETGHRLCSSDGIEIAAWSARPAKEPLATVVLCHGFATSADDGGAFPPLRDSLLSHGFGVVRFDVRAHGESAGAWRDLSLAGWRRDIEASIRFAIGLGKPVVVLAASFAAGAALAALEAGAGAHSFVLWNPVLDYRRTFLTGESWGAEQILASAGSPGMPDWAAYRIPWSGAVISHSLVAEIKADQTSVRLAALRLPGLVLFGSRDRIVPPAATREALASAPRSVSHFAVPLAGHGFRGFRFLVRAITIRWLLRTVRAHAPAP